MSILEHLNDDKKKTINNKKQLFNCLAVGYRCLCGPLDDALRPMDPGPLVENSWVRISPDVTRPFLSFLFLFKENLHLVHVLFGFQRKKLESRI